MEPLFPTGRRWDPGSERGVWTESPEVFMGLWVGHRRTDISGGKCREETMATGGHVFVEMRGFYAGCVTSVCHVSGGHWQIRAMHHRDGRAE